MKIYETNNQRAVDFFNEFIDSNKTNFKRYVFGYNQYSSSLINELSKLGIVIDGIIDDFTNDRCYILSKNIRIPIIKITDLESYSTTSLNTFGLPLKVVVVVTSQTRSAIQKLTNLNSNIDLDYIDYFALQKASRELVYKDRRFDLLELEFFDVFKRGQVQKGVSTWSDFRDDYYNHCDKYEEIFNKLEDIESKNQFEKIINFRINQDYSFMKDFDFVPHEQYFEEFYDINRVKYFFDIGAYRGETSLEFASRCSEYEQIYYFEPDSKNFSIATNILESKLSRAVGFNIGLANVDDSILFCSNDTSGHILNNVDNHDGKEVSLVPLSRLDTLISKGSITIDQRIIDGGGLMLVKLDIESAEIEALYGMRRFIERYHPIIAVCVYHSFDDFWNIPRVVLDMRQDYKMYFRHYSSGLTESVMWFIPKIKFQGNTWQTL